MSFQARIGSRNQPRWFESNGTVGLCHCRLGRIFVVADLGTLGEAAFGGVHVARMQPDVADVCSSISTMRHRRVAG
jgi:hypothetical protein